MDWSEILKCRACLADDVGLLPLFDVYEHNLTLADILQSCLGKEVLEQGLPRYLCENCVSVVTEFYNFTVIYEENVSKLKAFLNAKDESVSEENEVPDVFCNSETVEQEEKPETDKVCEENDQVTIKTEEQEKNRDLDFHDEHVKTEMILSVYEEDFDDTLQSEETALSDETEAASQSSVANQETRIPYYVENEDGTIYEERTKYECKDCGDTFLFSSGIISHMYKKHQMQDVDADDYAVKILVKIKKHQNSALMRIGEGLDKMEEWSPKCVVCKEIFDTPDSLKKHMLIHKTFVCEVCGNSFIKKSYLEDHKEAHGTEKRYKCKFCGKCFKRRTVLVKHKRIHTHPRQCVCEVCGKRFNDNGTLKTHRLLLHIKERNYKCVICGQAFPLKPTLDKHIRRHMKRENGEKDFACDKCEMRYRDKSSLSRHQLAKHSGVARKVRCEDCGKEYTSTTNLFKHRRIHHRHAHKTHSICSEVEISELIV